MCQCSRTYCPLSPYGHVRGRSVQGVPSKDYKLSASWLKEGCAVINVSTFKNVDEEEVLKVINDMAGGEGAVFKLLGYSSSN